MQLLLVIQRDRKYNKQQPIKSPTKHQNNQPTTQIKFKQRNQNINSNPIKAKTQIKSKHNSS